MGKERKITDEQILADIRDGYTRQQIADRHGVHVENLARRMHKLGVHATYAKNLGGTPRKIFGECWHYVGSHDKYIKDKYPEFQYLESKNINNNRTRRIRLKCKTCGSIIERARSIFKQKGIECECCKEKKQLEEGRAKMVRFLITLAQSKTPKNCSCCGVEFYSPYANAVYCSEKCKRKAKRVRHKERYPGHKKGKRTRGYISRAKKYGCEYEYGITIKSVIKRDGEICKICGKPCDLNDRTWGEYGPYYPTVDHIIPLSKGGSHTWNNVQLAHMICNSYKRDLYTVKREEVWT